MTLSSGVERHPQARPRPQPAWSRHALTMLCVTVVIIVSALDWLTPAGVVVGIFLTVPILLASFTRSPYQIWTISVLAHLSFGVAATWGREPISPPAVWLPNRVITLMSLLASTGVALLMHRHRLASERARDEALHARDTTRLLMSLLAHDLRTPLAMAADGLEAVEDDLLHERPEEREQIRNLRQGLGRSLRAVELVLAAARRDLEARVPVGRMSVSAEILAEAEAFRGEAHRVGQTIHLDIRAEIDPAATRVNRLVLRQTLAILLGNAVRYADPGRVTVSALRESRQLVVRVADGGPGFTAARARRTGADPYSGLGLELARSLLHLVGGDMRIERDSPDGSCVAVRLPLDPQWTVDRGPQRTEDR